MFVHIQVSDLSLQIVDQTYMMCGRAAIKNKPKHIAENSSRLKESHVCYCHY